MNVIITGIIVWMFVLVRAAVILIRSGSSSPQDRCGLMSSCCVELRAADNKSNNNTNADITVTLERAGHDQWMG